MFEVTNYVKVHMNMCLYILQFQYLIQLLNLGTLHVPTSKGLQVAFESIYIYNNSVDNSPISVTQLEMGATFCIISMCFSTKSIITNLSAMKPSSL